MNLFVRELRANRRALVIWSICMVLLVVSGMAKFTAGASGGQSLNSFFKNMPATLKALFGIGSFDLSTAGGYFAMLFSYIELAAGIHAVLLGASAVAGEERAKTTEFILVKPVSRETILTAKLVSALLNIVIINLVSLVSSIEIVGFYNKGRDITGEIIVFFAGMLIVQLIFLTLGAALSAVSRKPKSSGQLAAGILLGAFVISKITDMAVKLKPLNFLSPFKYFDFGGILAGKGLGAVPVILSLLLAAAFTVVTFVLYRKKDLSV